VREVFGEAEREWAVDDFRVPYPVWLQWDSGSDVKSLPGGGHKGDRIVLTESGTDGGPNSSSRR
jgi:hypothetical protein